MLSTNGIYEGANPIRVLHVEDELGAIKITRVYLEKAGYNDFKITPVLTAEQALETLETDDFDIVISDYMMPGMNGLEFLDTLRKNGNDIPFIIFTGRGDEGVAIEALNKGASRYIKKAGRPDVLFNTLGRHIRELVEDMRKGEAHNALSNPLEEEKEIKSLERNGKDQIPQGSHIDASTVLNKNIDLIILGLLVDLLADEDTIQSRMSEDELIEEIHRKFGIRIDSGALHTSVVNLKGKGMIIEIGGRIALLPKSATYHHTGSASV